MNQRRKARRTLALAGLAVPVFAPIAAVRGVRSWSRGRYLLPRPPGPVPVLPDPNVDTDNDGKVRRPRVPGAPAAQPAPAAAAAGPAASAAPVLPSAFALSAMAARPNIPVPALPAVPAVPAVPVPAKESRHMSHATLTNITDAIPEIGRFTPDNVQDFDTFLGNLPHFFETAAAAFLTLSERSSSELPFATPVSDHFAEIANACASATDLAGDARQIFRTQHEAEIARIENPRNGEDFFDVSKQ